MINLKQILYTDKIHKREFAICYLLWPQLSEIFFVIEYNFLLKLHTIEPMMKSCASQLCNKSLTVTAFVRGNNRNVAKFVHHTCNIIKINAIFNICKFLNFNFEPTDPTLNQ